MKIDWTPDEKSRGPMGKYPWRHMHDIGDYFDIPPGNPQQQAGVLQAAQNQRRTNGYCYRTVSLPDGTKRVFLAFIEDL